MIAGVTGLVGSHCLRFLLASPEYASVTALVRRSTGIKDPKFHERMVDFDTLSDLLAADDVFCSLGTTIRKAGSQAEFRKVDFQYPVRLAERTLAGGARQFVVVSSVGANPKSSNFYLRTKGELEEALKQLRLPSRAHLSSQFPGWTATGKSSGRRHRNGYRRVFEVRDAGTTAEVSPHQG